MNPSLPLDVFDSMHELMRMFRQRLRKALVNVHPELTFNETRVLMRTGRVPGLTQRELVEHSHADKAQMARILAQLEQRGWLTRSASENDRRVRCLRLSAEGERIFAQVRQLQERIAAELLSDCSAEAQLQLVTLLREMRNNATATEEILEPVAD